MESCWPTTPDFGRSNRKRTAPGSITNAYSAKRRRISHPSVDLTHEFKKQPLLETKLGPESPADRFITSRPRHSLPLSTTPRTRRIAQIMYPDDDAENRVLHCASSSSEPASQTSMRSLFRHYAQELTRAAPPARPTSVTANLGQRKQCLMALDTPGIPQSTFTSPIAWSHSGCIAVTCNNSVHFQHLETKSVGKLCIVDREEHGNVNTIEWAPAGQPDILALGTSIGTVQLWAPYDITRPSFGMMLHQWEVADGDRQAKVGALAWNEHVLAAGRRRGKITLYDTRAHTMIRELDGHKSEILGLQWNVDGTYMASGDDSGIVHIWDSRASKFLTESARRGPKLRHRGPVKALAWCPWQSDLLAIGSSFPDGSINIYSASQLGSPPAPLHTIKLNTSVLSLHWSPHCRELLSTHGNTFQPPSEIHTSHNGTMPTTRTIRQTFHRGLKPVSASPLTNSIVVHAYPSCKRLLTVKAHIAPVVHSCLSPEGTKLFTACPAEEAMKMWKVWDERAPVEKKESMFDAFRIR
ncbi:hypothetical protein HGRIS_006875 [Hohenbuehelia grisea]|uniref:CDC20/Fizzy WD40 domain-containing protein n=1 Tax=Hohenbuehelia grisea TaxID=104357 RepID=A0ABR3JAN9_9AGAR